MKVGVLSPTTWQLVEKMASLFPEGVEVVGPLSDDGHYWNDYRRKVEEWEDLGLRVSLRLEPYSSVDFSAYDLLIESIETFGYAADWREHCERLECPIVVKACWTRSPLELAPPEYIAKTRGFPVLLEMPAHERAWAAAGYSDVNVIPNPVGQWWFDRQWTGENERALFVLSGADDWRGSDPSRFGLEIWDEISRAFPGRTHHHDGHVSYLTSREMTDLFCSSRVFVNLDRPYGQGERPLTLAFTEALSAGLPVVARDLPGLSYRNLIDDNGVCTNDLAAMCDFIERCLTDREFARACGGRSREIAFGSFSQTALRPQYDEIVERAQREFATPARRSGHPGDDFASLAAIVDSPVDLSLEQWHRLYERALASGADLLVEVGRGYGNSTVVLTEAAHRLGRRVVSLDADDQPRFEGATWPKLRPVVGEDWRRRLAVFRGDAREFTPPDCERCFLFWDVHGVDVAQHMLDRVIPALPSGSTVVVHDVSNAEEAAAQSDSDVGYTWNGLVSPFPELPVIGAWLDERGIVWEHDTGMLAFAV